MAKCVGSAETKEIWPSCEEEYQLGRVIGAGGAAIVQMAKCIPLNKMCAIKRVNIRNNSTRKLDALKETIVLKSLNHKNIVNLYNSFMVGSELWLVMSLSERGSLSWLIKEQMRTKDCRQGVFNEETIATVLKEVLKGLAYIHSKGLLHRDIKAGNILVSRNGTVQIGDFGLSAWLSTNPAVSQTTTLSRFAGTLCWMAPEIMKGEEYDYKADIWSFGITAIEMATGTVPHKKSKYTSREIISLALKSEPPNIETVYAGENMYEIYGTSLREMIAECLQKDPKKRPTAAELLKHPFFKKAKDKQFLVQAFRCEVDELQPVKLPYRSNRPPVVKELVSFFSNDIRGLGMQRQRETYVQKPQSMGVPTFRGNIASRHQPMGLPTFENNNASRYQPMKTLKFGDNGAAGHQPMGVTTFGDSSTLERQPIGTPRMQTFGSNSTLKPKPIGTPTFGDNTASRYQPMGAPTFRCNSTLRYQPMRAPTFGGNSASGRQPMGVPTFGDSSTLERQPIGMPAFGGNSASKRHSMGMTTFGSNSTLKPMETPMSRGNIASRHQPMGAPTFGDNRAIGRQPMGVTTFGSSSTLKPMETPMSGGNIASRHQPMGAPTFGGNSASGPQPMEAPTLGDNRALGRQPMGTPTFGGNISSRRQPMGAPTFRGISAWGHCKAPDNITLPQDEGYIREEYILFSETTTQKTTV